MADGRSLRNSAGEPFDPQVPVSSITDLLQLEKLYETAGQPFNPPIVKDSPADHHWRQRLSRRAQEQIAMARTSACRVDVLRLLDRVVSLVKEFDGNDLPKSYEQELLDLLGRSGQLGLTCNWSAPSGSKVSQWIPLSIPCEVNDRVRILHADPGWLREMAALRTWVEASFADEPPDWPRLLASPQGCPSPLREAYELVAAAVYRAWEVRNSTLSGPMFREEQARPLSAAWKTAKSHLEHHEVWLFGAANDALETFHAAQVEVERINHACGHVVLKSTPLEAPAYLAAQANIDANQLLQAMREATCSAAFRSRNAASGSSAVEKKPDRQKKRAWPRGETIHTCPNSSCQAKLAEDYRILPEVVCPACGTWKFHSGCLVMPVAGDLDDSPEVIRVAAPYWMPLPPTPPPAQRKEQAVHQSNAIRVLFLAANPRKTKQLALDEESRAIKAKIWASEHRDFIEVITEWAIRPGDLMQFLNQHKPHVVHFSGHGSDTAEIFLQDDKGQPKPVSAKALTAAFRAVKNQIRLVFLNACFSQPQAEAIVEEIDFAIGMGMTISDTAAITFAASFYRALGFGCSVQNAFDQGIAAMQMEGIDEEDTPRLLVRQGMDAGTAYFVRPQ